jgi:hypothetical protein
LLESTADYEEWLGSQTTLVAPEIQFKTPEDGRQPVSIPSSYVLPMAQLFPRHCSELNNAPRVLGVGDLHIENFGTGETKTDGLPGE